MKKIFSVLATVMVALPAVATPNRLANDNGLMANVPGFGPSRVETVTFCLNEAGVDRYQDLLTDHEFSRFGACMKDNT
jgi:hypothetical protein